MNLTTAEILAMPANHPLRRALEAAGPVKSLKPLWLPWPPSVNRCWRAVNGKVILSAEGRQYRAQVNRLIAGTVRINGRLSICINVYPPDRRRRDIDNLLKAPLDALKHAGVYADDEQIDRITIQRQGVQKDGAMCVEIEEVTP